MPGEYRTRLTRQAMDDINEIREFIGRDSARHAARMVERLFDEFDRLELFPHRAVVEYFSSRLDYPVRKVSVKPYVIYFRVDEAEKVIVIRHIRHGSRRPPDDFEPAE